LELPIAPSGVYGGRGTIFAPENPIFQSKNRFPAVFAPGNLLDFSKNWRGWPGELASPATSLSKSF
ncbi:MAG: hypothetical protein PUK86_07030, partial [bacterium]|nr:hypothetical protein [bacterium]